MRRAAAARPNPELGGEAGFALFASALRARGMGLVMDVVPNHMCIAGSDNRWWTDLLENGPGSPHARFFDVDWNPPEPSPAGGRGRKTRRLMPPWSSRQRGRTRARGIRGARACLRAGCV